MAVKTKSAVKKPAPKKSEANAKPDFKKAAAGDVGAHEQSEKEPVPKRHDSEKLAPKLRRKADITKALKGDAHVLKTPEGLFRIIAGSKVHPASKRRIVAMIDSGLLKREKGSDSRYIYDETAEVDCSEQSSSTEQ